MSTATIASKTIRFAVGAALALTVFVSGHAARAEGITDYEVSTGLVCDTVQQVERFVSLYNGDNTAKAVKAVNAEAHSDSACSIETLAFVRGKEAGTIHRGDHAFAIVHILVLGVATDEGIRAIKPAAFFTVFSVTEYGV
jgi:hypothetical protein